MSRRADQYRDAREAFVLAMELGCTPREAMRELRRRRVAARLNCGRLAEEPEAVPSEPEWPVPTTDFHTWTAPWMMRD